MLTRIPKVGDLVLYIYPQKIVLEETLLKEFHDRQIPRWKQEADNVIKKYTLEIIAD